MNVENNLPSDGTSIHYHGLIQAGHPWYDGTPASQVCPIAPGTNFTQTFTADQYGSSWWHSHYSAQHVDGAKGPIVFYGPTTAQYDVDLGPVFLNDWYHQSYLTEVAEENGVPGVVKIVPDSNLINGKGQFNCTLGFNCTSSTPYSKFNFQTGKRHLLRVISAAADLYQCFSIDGHLLQIISADFTPVEPYYVDCLSLHDGQRADVIVTANQSSTSSWLMRAKINNGIPGSPQTNPEARAVVYYPNSNHNVIPNTTINAGVASECGISNEAVNVPASPQTPGQPATESTIDISIQVNATGHTLFYLNNSTFRGDYNYPVGLLAKMGNYSYPEEWNVYNFGSNSSIRMTWVSNLPIPHPMHLHGHTMSILYAGVGAWNGSIPQNPSRRDTVVLPPASPSENAYLVVQWEANNPGVWPFHCHLAW